LSDFDLLPIFFRSGRADSDFFWAAFFLALFSLADRTASI